MSQLPSVPHIFFFFQASFEDDARIAFLTLLEYEPNEVREKIAEKTGSKPANAQAHEQGKYILMVFGFFGIENFDILLDFMLNCMMFLLI